MQHNCNQVRDFWEGLYRVTGDQLYLPCDWENGSDQKDWYLAKIIREESEELLQAILHEKAEDILKEICDVLYVVLGAATTYNLDVVTAFNRVHDNNMLKVKEGVEVRDGKLIKSPDHPKVYLKDLV